MKKNYFHISLSIIAIAAMTVACSTRKNTSITRAYHQLTTHYNVLFNARESYRKGLLKAEADKKDDYTHILPLFLYGDKNLASLIGGDMSVASQKATKAINLHSITAKPKVGKGGMTPEQKKYYDKHEFNKYIDDCYLLVGQTYVYSGEYFLATKTFSFMETEFPNDPVLYEARIWKAKSLMLEKKYRDAASVLDALAKDEKFPNNKALRADMEATTADLYIRQQNYAQAIPHLEEALLKVKNKKTKMRWQYVLAQLYLEQKNYGNALDGFRAVIRMSPPYEMQFNATISMATASSSTNAAEMKAQLLKMLADFKNKEYQDQIYFALAEVEMSEGHTEAAISYYQQSAAHSTVNVAQKVKSYLTLADWFYQKHNYVPAQAYYDSVMMNMQADYPNYVKIASKARNLTTLVGYLNTIHFQDSVQRIAKMSEIDRTELIDNLIAGVQAKESADKQRANTPQTITRQSTLPSASGKAQWYFYNPTTVSAGKTNFKEIWGNRPLEDNWRRSNKGILSFLSTEDKGEEAPTISDTHKREYYLQFVPLNDSMMQASNQKIMEALYTSAYMYNNDFGELDLAAAQYEDLLRRYPNGPLVNAAHYYLYQLYTKMNNGSAAERHKTALLERAPESTFAMILKDPTYLDRLSEEQNEASTLYEQLYESYNAGWYQQVVAKADEALKRYPKDDLKPKFAYLRALSAGRLGTPATMRAEMTKIVEQYKGNEVAVAAQNMIDYLDEQSPDLKKAAQAKEAVQIYAPVAEKEVHYFGWILQRKEDMNQLSFDLMNFNMDNFPKANLEISRQFADSDRPWLMVKSFPDKTQAENFYKLFTKDASVVKNVRFPFTTVLISEENFKRLEKEKKMDEYIEFFKQSYLKQ